MRQMLTPAAWWWKPVAAVAVAALLATWADAAPPTPTQTTTTSADATATADPTGQMAEIVALARFLADELELTFADPLEEASFFFAFCASRNFSVSAMYVRRLLPSASLIW